MDTPMLKKLKEYLRITPKEQKEQDWKEVKEMGLKGVTAEELINNTYFRLVWCFVNDEKKYLLRDTYKKQLVWNS